MVSEFYDTPTKQFRWNWGAFMYTVVFGFANRAWPFYLCFIPIFNLIWVFVCGAMGERWVWKAGHFEDGKTFRAVMDSWHRAGKFAFVFTLILLCIFLILVAIGFFMWRQAGYPEFWRRWQ